jgi:hypothetical protein
VYIMVRGCRTWSNDHHYNIELLQHGKRLLR